LCKAGGRVDLNQQQFVGAAQQLDTVVGPLELLALLQESGGFKLNETATVSGAEARSLPAADVPTVTHAP